MLTLRYDLKGYGRHIKGTVEVTTLAEAVEEHERLVSEAETGATGHRRFDVLRDGKSYARISFNGRVWAAHDDELEIPVAPLSLR